MRTAAACPLPQGVGRQPDATVTNATPGEKIRVEIDSGDANRQEVEVSIQVKDPNGGGSTWHSEVIFVGDTPVEWEGPVLPHRYDGQLMRVRIADVATGEAIADDIVRL